MFNLFTKTLQAATLALGALPIVAVATAAHSQPATVRISDLNLSRAAHVAIFEGRVDHVAKQICDGYADPRNLSMQAACKASVRAEAMNKLSTEQSQAGASFVASR